MKNGNSLQYIVEHASELARAGVRLVEVGEGASRVRVEFDRLPTQRTSATVAEPAQDEPSGRVDERAGEPPPARTGEDADEPSAVDLDLAHLDDGD